MAAAEEISEDAAVAAELDGIFTLKKDIKKSTEGLLRWTKLFCFNPPDLLWLTWLMLHSNKLDLSTLNVTHR